MKYKILNQIGFNKIILCFFVLSFFLPNLSQASVVGKTIKRPSDSSLNNGLLGYWTLDGNKINWATGAVIDSSGNNITGTTTNMSTTSSPTAGISGQGLYFDGVNDAVNLNKPSSMNFSGSADFSLSLWVKPTHVGFYQCFLCKLGSLNPGGKGLMLGTYASETRFMFTIRDGTNSIGPISSSVPFGKWYHLTATYNASTKTAYLYVNSVRGNPNTNLNLGDSSDTANLLIGDWVTNNSLYNARGSIDEVRIYNRVLSDSEVRTLYSQGVSEIASTNSGLPSTGLNSGLVGWWTFDGKDLKTNVTDRSTSSNTGSLKNITATSSSVVIGKIGQAMSFDGSNDYMISKNIVNTQTATVSAWVKIKEYPSQNGHIAGFINGIGSVTHDKNLYIGTDGKLYFYVYDGTTKTTSAPSSALPLNKWVHVIGVADGVNAKAYVNGVEVGTVSAGNTYASYNVANIFVNGATGNVTYGGGYSAMQTDDVRVWNRALSTTEILQLYNQGKANI